MYINLGYWARARNLDEACQDMAEELGITADLTSDDEVLDVGCGFGDQNIYWMERFSPRKITALNITPSQVEIARSRVAAKAWCNRLHFVVGDATHLSFPSNSFHKVLALESAFHFVLREDFLREAFRVLRPGGLLVTADFVERACREHWSPSGWIAMQLGTRAWQIPRENLYGATTYIELLQRSGFVDIEVRCISDQVLEPFTAFQRPRFNDPAVGKRFHPLVLTVAKWQIDLGFLRQLDYVMVRARKGGGAAAVNVMAQKREGSV